MESESAFLLKALFLSGISGFNALKTILIAGFEIGLYLRSEILQYHDGKPFFKDTPGKGSNFNPLCLQQEQVKL